MAPQPRSRRWRLLIGIGAAAVLLAGGAVVFALTRTGDISNPNVEFQPEPQATLTPTPTPKPHEDPADRFVWPVYGYTEDRRRYLAGRSLRPPYARLWSVRAGALLEFPPIIANRYLYLMDNDGFLRAIRKKGGHVRWKRRLGVLAASSPAYADGKLYVTILSRAPGQPGRVAGLRARDGKVLWSRDLPSRSESSPLVDGGRVYFGSENGTVYALDADTGAVRWTYHAAGAVKCGLALWQGKLYFGDYAGKVYAIRRADGHEVWRTGTSGAEFGLSSGQFYATPAVAFGRVYIGNTDHYMYSFAATNGKLAWRKGTGAYVYSSPAVAQVPGGRPAVYFGSYDGTFYALDARSGGVLWTHAEGGTISGGTTIVGDVVYFSNNRHKTTTGLGARTGRVVFRFPHGAFNPVVSDGERIFLTGSSSLYALRPKSRR